MKKVCFLEFEGVIASFKNYSPVGERINSFLKELTGFCKENNIELFLVCGYYEGVAKKKFLDNGFNSFFDETHFVFVDDYYINNKKEEDKNLHLDNLKKDSEFNDSFFKQVLIQRILREKNLVESDALLLCNDIWVDGYYTTRFSKIDFALFKNNLTDRGNKVELINGLVYFDLDFSSVRGLLIDFPKLDFSSLDKYVFEVMKSVLVEDSVKDSIRENILKKRFGRIEG
ncbi:MAG: hypothetical protein WC290_02660 [archaeon]|jgi:hypothetical protein|nr:hypothetical protein [Candidatus ainarchaeum sp.]